jgi:hypothetical protein
VKEIGAIGRAARNRQMRAMAISHPIMAIMEAVIISYSLEGYLIVTKIWFDAKCKHV